MYTTLLILIIFVSKSSCLINKNDKTNCDKIGNVLDISNGKLLPNGDINFNEVEYAKSEYYIDERGLKKVCLCKKKVCIQKCCPSGLGVLNVLDTYTPYKCVDVTTPFEPQILDENNTTISRANISEIFHFSYGFQDCKKGKKNITVGSTGYFKYFTRKDGKLYIEEKMAATSWMLVGPDEYCIDTFVTTDETGKQTLKVDALVCFGEDEEVDTGHYIMTSTCMAISCVFILATVGVYMWLPELRNLHGRVLMAYLLCLFVAFLFLAIMQIGLIHDTINIITCTSLTFCIYFVLLSAFFWLNVMSFDIWWTFSGKRGLALERLSIRGRFCAYAMYAFGVPTVLTIIMAALEFTELEQHHLLPNIRKGGCFLNGHSKLLYLYLPIVILWTANLVFFILTAIKIARIKHQTAVLKSKESTTHDQQRKDQQRLFLYIKLFVLMGFNWVLEVISALYPEGNSFWRFTDAYNLLIGPIIFIIFVCKRKIFRLIKKRYRQLRGDSMSRSATATSRTTSREDTSIKIGFIKNNGTGATPQ